MVSFCDVCENLESTGHSFGLSCIFEMGHRGPIACFSLESASSKLHCHEVQKEAHIHMYTNSVTLNTQ